ncbi:MAG TPA: hypothetical protein VGN26_18435 [Armatimonadota bacterium]
MPRTAAQTRRPSEADLTDSQREIYSALPEKLRHKYLDGLPSIRVPAAQKRRKTERIRQQLEALDRVLPVLQDHRNRLDKALTDLDAGGDPRGVDLRQVLRPPTLEGVVFRYSRSRKG